MMSSCTSSRHGWWHVAEVRYSLLLQQMDQRHQMSSKPWTDSPGITVRGRVLDYIWELVHTGQFIQCLTVFNTPAEWGKKSSSWGCQLHNAGVFSLTTLWRIEQMKGQDRAARNSLLRCQWKHAGLRQMTSSCNWGKTQEGGIRYYVFTTVCLFLLCQQIPSHKEYFYLLRWIWITTSLDKCDI